MGDFRAELAALVAAYDEHRKWTLNAVFEGLHQAVERARAVLAAAPQIEAPGWCETDAEQYAWQAGWEARDDAMLQPSLPLARLPKNAQVIEPTNHTILAPIPTPIPVSERLPGPEDCQPWPDEPDADPWCWLGSNFFDGGWEWEQRSVQFLRHYGNEYTHWLPAHALPLPEVE